MKPISFILTITFTIFVAVLDPNLSFATPRNIYGVRKSSSSRLTGVRKLNNRFQRNATALYGVRRLNARSLGSRARGGRLFGGLRNNYFGSGIFNSSSGDYDNYQYNEPKQKTECYGEARALCN